MTSLLISYSDIPGNAYLVQSSAAHDPEKPSHNLVAGERYSYFQFNAAATSGNVKFSTGSTTKSADHLVIARADILQALTCTSVVLSRGTDGSAFTAEKTVSSFNSQTLYGPDGNDFITTFTASSAFKWWRLEYSGSSSKFTHSKAYFGTMFDWGEEPVEFPFIRSSEAASWLSGAGAEYLMLTDSPRYQISLTWEGVTDEKVESFYDNIVRWKESRPVFLYTATQHQVLDSKRLIHCKLTNCERVSPYTNYNNVRAEFVEILG